MVSIETTRLHFEELITKNLNVSNPALLKSGVLGLLTDYLTNIKYDLSQYYTKVFREMNPGLAQDFNSMLFHSTIYRTDIKLATPATFSVSFIIPEITSENIKYQIYKIDKNFTFTDTNGIDYLIPDEIEIQCSHNNYKAYVYYSTMRKELSITKAPDPINAGKYVYLVNYDNVKQLKRTLKKIVVPHYNIGTSENFAQTIEDYTGLVSVKAWYNETGTPANLSVIEKYEAETISQIFDYEQFNIKYYKFGSTRFDLDLFLKIYQNSITLETGNGIIGKYLKANNEIILEVITTLGEKGNLKNTSFLLNDIKTELITKDGTSRIFRSSLNGVSGIGGEGGRNVSTIDEIRQNIFDNMTFRNSLVSVNDFETYFKYNGFKPFVDAKFLDARSFIFLFNVFQDNLTQKVIPTTSINYPELAIAQDPFYPTIEYNGKEMISPFYYKFLTNNDTEAYIVNPKIPISLTMDLSNSINTDYNNLVSLELQYDFSKRKSLFSIVANADPNKIYKIYTNNFSFTLEYANNFTWEVNTLFTDSYCIVKEPITSMTIEIYDQENNLLTTLKSYEEYYQLSSKQIMYKYYKHDQNAGNIAARVDTASLASEYLDNELRSLLIQAQEIINPLVDDSEIPTILRIPLMDKTYFEESDWYRLYEQLDQFYSVNKSIDKIQFNTRVAQTFYNTIDIPEKYQDLIFKINNNYSKSNPQMKINVNVYIDKESFNIDNTFKSLQELNLSLKIDILNFFKQKIGFQVKYYESELENYLYEKYNNQITSIGFLKNIEVISPNMFEVNNSDSIFYLMKNSENITFDDMIDFVPPFFYYDLNNITLQIKY